MYQNFFIHSSVDEHLGSFHVPAIINGAVINTLGYLCLFQLWFSQGICPVIGLLGHMVALFLVVFFFFKESHTVLHSGCISLHSHQECKWVPFPPHPHQHLLFIDCFNNGHSDWCEALSHWFLICNSLIMSDVEHRFLCLLATCMSSLEKKLFRSFSHF